MPLKASTANFIKGSVNGAGEEEKGWSDAIINAIAIATPKKLTE